MILKTTNGGGRSDRTIAEPTVTDGAQLAEILDRSARQHSHLCPRQVLGARLGLLGLRVLGFDDPPPDKGLHAFVETDGCFIDGVSAATGCRVGARTLHVIDYGKMAATVVDAVTELAYRIHPRSAARGEALKYAPGAPDQWNAYLQGYQRMPDDLLFEVDKVDLVPSIRQIISMPEAKAVCRVCREEIFNGREVLRGRVILCRSCAGETYWLPGGI